MSQLTEKQNAVFQMLAQAVRAGASIPTYREMAARLGCDVRAVYQHVQALERAGIVERLGGHRGLRLTAEHQPQRGLPVIGRVAAGLPILAEQNIDEYVDLGHVMVDPDSFLLKVKGDSMVDRHILDGDMVLVRPQPSLTNGEIGVVCVNGEATVKEVHLQRDRLTLISHNALRNYPVLEYSRRDVDLRIVGKVMLAFRFM